MNTWNEIDWGKIIKAALLALLIILASVFAKNQNFAAILQFLRKNPRISFLIFLTAYVFLGITVVPSDPLTVYIVTFSGPLSAIILATIGNTLAAIIEYSIGETAGNLGDFEKRRSGLPFHLGELPVNSPRFLLLSRMVPWLGSKFVSVICGAYQVPLFSYIWTTTLANIVGSTVIAYGGYGLFRLILSLI